MTGRPGGGITEAENLTVATSGNSSAAIRTDRGGGRVTVAKGRYSASGMGSPAIYSTADITVKDVKLTNSASGVLLDVSADSWGWRGRNGGNAEVYAHDQILNGEIRVDQISFLRMALSGKSTFTGKINASGQKGTVQVIIPKDCVWTLTGDSYITGLSYESKEQFPNEDSLERFVFSFAIDLNKKVGDRIQPGFLQCRKEPDDMFEETYPKAR